MPGRSADRSATSLRVGTIGFESGSTAHVSTLLLLLGYRGTWPQRVARIAQHEEPGHTCVVERASVPPPRDSDLRRRSPIESQDLSLTICRDGPGTLVPIQEQHELGNGHPRHAPHVAHDLLLCQRRSVRSSKCGAGRRRERRAPGLAPGSGRASPGVDQAITATRTRGDLARRVRTARATRRRTSGG